jgi:hypothetical protein
MECVPQPPEVGKGMLLDWVAMLQKTLKPVQLVYFRLDSASAKAPGRRRNLLISLQWKKPS